MANKLNNIWLWRGYFHHRKTKKLKRLVGIKGSYCFLNLMTYIGESKPTGILEGMTPEDIAAESEWLCDKDYEEMESGELEAHIKKFTDSLVKSEWMEYDKKTKTFSVPSFSKRQIHIQPEYKKKLSKAGSKGGNAKWGKMTVSVEKCPWTEQAGEHINVLCKKLPPHISLDGDYYKDRAAWEEMFWNQSPSEKNKLNNKIKTNTKICEKCKKLFINDTYDTCHECQGD